MLLIRWVTEDSGSMGRFLEDLLTRGIYVAILGYNSGSTMVGLLMCILCCATFDPRGYEWAIS